MATEPAVETLRNAMQTIMDEYHAAIDAAIAADRAGDRALAYQKALSMAAIGPHMLTKHGTPEDGTHYVQKGIPKPLRPQFGGIPTLRVKMPQRDLGAAYVASQPVWADLNRQIAAARAKSEDHMQVEILKFRSRYEKYKGKPLDKAGYKLFDDLVEWLLREYGGLSVAAQPIVLAAHKSDLTATQQALPQPAQAVMAQQQIVGVAATRTRFKGPTDEKGEDSYFRDFMAATTVGQSSRYPDSGRSNGRRRSGGTTFVSAAAPTSVTHVALSAST